MFRSDEQERFYQLVARHMAEQDGPLLLEGGTGIGKTRAYLAAIAESNQRIAVVLPTYQLIDQVLNSDDLKATGVEAAAFRRADLFEHRRDYLANKEQVAEARVMLCTSASVLIDQRLRGGYNGVTTRDYIVFDEADQLPVAAGLQRDMRVDAIEFKDARIAVGDAKSAIEALLQKSNLDPELRGRASLIAEALGDPAWYKKVGINDEGGVTLWHRMPGRLLKKIANQSNVAFISATLQIGQKFDDFKRSLGIDEVSRFSQSIEPARHGTIEIIADYETSLAEIVPDAPRPCLVATASHADSQSFGAEIQDSIVRSAQETASDAVARLSADGVLIAAGVWAGLDTPARWASIVIPRVPFERPTELDGKIESRYIDSRNVASRRMRQVIGRGLRSPDASCQIFILDERHTQLGAFVPERFDDSWQEGQIEQGLRNERVRYRLFRSRVLEQYGAQCCACGLKPISPSILDVHHLDPISEGERRTKLEDLIPLCANCHRTAHLEKPPIPLERLKDLVGESG